jgi:hypothetical protein
VVRLTVAGVVALGRGVPSREEREELERLRAAGKLREEEGEESWIEVFVQSMQLGTWGPLKGEDNVDEEYGAKFCLRYTPHESIGTAGQPQLLVCR